MENKTAICLLNQTIIFSSFLFCTFANAQVTPDGTTSTTVNVEGNNFTINNGDRASGNLFHSFQDFSVPTDGSAVFNNPTDIVNIFSRVTGTNISDINGLIQANGGANLFLLNPNGIIFGENARLQIGGSFIGSTADSILFPDREFSTSNLNSPFLTINAPMGLNFRDNPGEITNRSIATPVGDPENFIGLEVSSEETIGLIGGDISIEGGVISTPGGRIELGSVSGNSQVRLSEVAKGWDLSYEGIENFGNINLDFAFINIYDASTGDIEVQGGNVSLINQSLLGIDTFAGQAGNLTVIASESLSLGTDSLGGDSPSFLFNNIFNNATGNNSTTTIEASQLTVNNGSQITSNVSNISNQAQGVDIIVNATNMIIDNFFVDNLFGLGTIQSGIFAQDGGSIAIQTDTLTLSRGGQISTETLGSNNAGDLTVDATKSVDLIGTVANANIPSGLFANVGQSANASGNAGNLTITTPQLVVRDGAQIGSAARNSGNGGTLSINAESIFLTGNSELAVLEGTGRSGIFVSAQPAFTDPDSGDIISTTGNGGTINLNTKDLTIEQGAFISINTFSEGNGGDGNINVSNLIIRNGGQIGAGSLIGANSPDPEGVRGNGGTLNINATESVEIIGVGDINGEPVNSSIFTLAQSTGNAGNINLTTNNLNILDGGDVNASASGQANAGNLSIQATNINVLDSTNSNTGIFAEVQETARGRGGNIELTSEQLNVSGNQARISVSNFGQGDAGNLDIATQQLVVSEGAQISSSTFGEGNAGNLTINATELLEVKGEEDFASGLFAQVNPGATGTGGNLRIQTERLSIEDSGKVQVSTFGEGDAGNLSVLATNIEILDTGIDSSFQTGIFAEVSSDASGMGGNLNIESSSLNIAGNLTRISVDNFGLGNAGNLDIVTNQLIARDGAQISASTSGEGNAGNLMINATELVELRGEGDFPTGLFAQVNPGATGAGGSLKLTTGQLNVIDGAKIQVSTFGAGDSGDLFISATDVDIFETPINNFFSTGIFAQVASNNAQGNAGDLTIKTNDLSIRDGGQVSASTFGEGNAGNLLVQANNTVEVVGVENPDVVVGSRNISTLSADVGEEAVGSGGSLIIEAQSLRVTDGGQISVSTSGQGNAGDLQISATDSVAVSGTSADNQFVSQLTVEAKPNSVGRGGNLTINAGELNLDRAQISAATGSGEGGNITLSIDDNITLRNNSLISAEATGTANGGNVTITDSEFIIAYPSQGDGNDILATAVEGTGGNIEITTKSLLNIEEREASANNQTNDIDASSDLGVDGTVTINNPDVNPLQGETELSNNVLETEQVTAQACSSDRASSKTTSLVIKNRGGLPPEATDPLIADPILSNGQITPPNPEVYYPEIKPIKTSIGDIYPARGVIKTETGQVILTAYPTDSSARTPHAVPNCDQT